MVLTYRRPRLATEVVRGLVDGEGLDPGRVVLVVNGEGGLTDPVLEERVVTVRLATNTGPAGGFRAGLVEAHRRFDAAWYYLCEDDVGLFDLPSPRLAALIARADAHQSETAAGGGAGAPVGAIVAYGRDLDPRSGLTVPHRPSATGGFEPVDVAAWGATLVSGRALALGLLPDAEWFFGYEDHDYMLRLRAAGLAVLVDLEAARAVHDRAFGPGRAAAGRGERPDDSREPWRAYYEARNFMEFRRRHGRARWTMAHLAKSARRAQLAGSWKARAAVARGLIDGFRGRLGREPRYQRGTGEI